ncbi:MAG TPA: polysaccharide ABC transporter ATP-binding protein [Opitutus sp.]|nr:polysaccharide ABC transporter ATP-binding protein [Opitutus sp.]
MSDLAVRAENLGKRYRLRHVTGGARYRTLRDDLAGLPARWFGKQRDAATEDFWALRDVSFTLKQGEVLGIVGRNGAGKSTLLKILGRITDPSAGGVDIFGRVGSLLEVGTGFHPELTGRENIFLSGAMLGMRRHEVRRRFDEIVAFAEVEKFLDTPCKHYSSGMFLRLGFAVAAHLDAEILLVDEVLAVGDAMFQKKCLGKMRDVGHSGRAILFVSHNTGAVTSLCTRAILIAGGKLAADGPAEAVVSRYMAELSASADDDYVADAAPRGPAGIAAIHLRTVGGEKRNTFPMSEPMVVACEFVLARESAFTFSVQVKESNFSPVFHFTSGDAGFALPRGPGRYAVDITLPALQLYPGQYLLRLALTDAESGFQTDVDGIGFWIEQDFAICARPLPRQAGLIFGRAGWALREPGANGQS